MASERVSAFIEEIISLCRRRGMLISHEDIGGAFEVRDFSEQGEEWLRAAVDCVPDPNEMAERLFDVSRKLSVSERESQKMRDRVLFLENEIAEERSARLRLAEEVSEDHRSRFERQGFDTTANDEKGAV
jgi:hypothetical protein